MSTITKLLLVGIVVLTGCGPRIDKEAVMRHLCRRGEIEHKWGRVQHRTTDWLEPSDNAWIELPDGGRLYGQTIRACSRTRFQVCQRCGTLGTVWVEKQAVDKIWDLYHKANAKASVIEGRNVALLDQLKTYTNTISKGRP
jgi:hypothetical protein